MVWFRILAGICGLNVGGAAIADEPQIAAFMRSLRKSAELRETATGLCYRFLTPGTGARPRPQDTIVISLKCMRADTMQEIPELGGDPLTVKVSALPTGLQEGVQFMPLESHAIFVVPPRLSLPASEWPASVPFGTPLAFVVVLHEIDAPDAE